MHLYLAARGILKDLREWEHDVSSIWTKYRLKMPGQFNVSGAPISDGIIRTAIRPIQLYEIVFPEESLDEFLGIIMPNGEAPYTVKPEHDKKRKSEYGKANQVIGWVRKFLHLEKLPEKWKRTNTVHTLMVNSNSIGIHPIGIKRDRRDIDGIEEL